MKILYAIQGTGNGHITCAIDLLPRLREKAEVDILLSGCQVDISLPYEIKYRLNGLSFIFGEKGGINYMQTFRKGKIKKLFREIMALPVEEYDLVISDFEPVSAWACRLKKVPCVGLSHQVAVLNKNAPRPKKNDPLGKAVLKYYAPVDIKIGYHYKEYDDGIVTPIIRKDIREIKVRDLGHYTVYLPSFSDKRIIRLLSMFPEIDWQVFSKHSKEAYVIDHIAIMPVSNKAFMESMASASGVICGSGFQTPAEVIYLKKKLIVIPMKGQYEQQCNAAALKELGVAVMKNIKRKRYAELHTWIKDNTRIDIEYPDVSDHIVDRLLNIKPVPVRQRKRQIDDFRSFWQLFKKKILAKG